MKNLHRIINQRYRVDRVLGAGGMGQVFLVQDLLEPAAEFLALKVIAVDDERQPQMVNWFKSEFATLSALRHPGLAQVFDFGIDQKTGELFYTSECINGRNFFETARNDKLENTLRIFAEVCLAVDFFHTKGILHNDLKPSNILIDEKSNRPKIVDFGLSQAFYEIPENDAAKSRSLSRIFGTPAFLAPEIIKGEPPSFKTDLYSLGMVLYQCVAGRLPFEQKKPRELFNAITEKRMPPPRRWNQSIPPAIEAVILEMLAKDPQKRPTNAREIYAQIATQTQLPTNTGDEINLLSSMASLKVIGRERMIRKIQQYIAKNIPDASPRGDSSFPSSSEWSLSDVSVQDFEKETPHAGFTILVGESGLGKTSLLRFLKNHYQLRHVPFFIIDHQTHPSVFSSWKRVFAEVSAISPGSILPAEPSFDRLDLFTKSTSFLIDAFRKQPFVIAFDNIDTADETSRAFFHHLDRFQAKNPLSRLPPILVSSKESAIIQDTFDLNRNDVRILPLLNAAQNLQLLKEFFSTPNIPEDFARKVFERSGGNPQFIQEILSDLVASGILKRKRHLWNLNEIDIQTIKLAPSLKTLLQKRFAALPNIQKEILGFSAVWRFPVGFKELRSLVSFSQDRLKAHVNLLENSGLLLLEEAAYRIPQRGLIEVIFHEIAELPQYHLRCARYLEKAQPKALDRIAWHFAEAGRPKDATAFALDSGKFFRKQGDPEKALSLFQLAAEQAVKSNFSDATIPALAGAGEILWRRGDRSEACKVFQQLTQQSKPGTFAAERRLAGKHLGIFSRDRGDWEKANQYFQFALDETKTSERNHRAEIHGHMALVAQASGKNALAAQLLERARSTIVEKRRFLKGSEATLILLGYISIQREELSEAENFFLEALHFATQSKDERRKAIVYINLGSIAARRGSLDQAGQYFEQSVQISERLGDGISTCNGLIYLGNSQYAQGHYATAASVFQRASELASRMDHLPFLATIRLALGLLEIDRGNFHLAKPFLDFAKTIRGQLKDRKGLLYILQGYENLYLQLGLFETARKYIEDINRKTSDSRFRISSLLNQLTIAIHLEDRALATASLQKAKQMLEDNPNSENSLLLSIREANWHLRTGDSAQAEIILTEATSNFSQTSNKINRGFLDLSRFRLRLDHLSSKRSAEDLQFFLKEVEAFLTVTAYNENFSLDWQTRLLFARATEISGDTTRAYEIYHNLQDRFYFISDNLEPKWRKAFLDDPEKQFVFESIERLRHTSELASKELQDAKRQIEQYRRLQDINRQLTADWKNRDHLLQHILDTALDLVQARRGFIILGDSQNLSLVAAKNLSKNLQWNPENEFSRSVVSEVLISGQPKVFIDACQESSLAESRSVFGLQLRSVVCVPLRLGPKGIGVLYLDHDRKSGCFSKDQVDLLSALANQATIVLQVSDSFHELENNFEEASRKFQEAQAIIQTQARALEQQYPYSRIIGGRDASMQKVFSLLDRVIPTDVTVLIEGESGTGKELVAQAIHYNGPRREHLLVSINCAGLNPHLLESELFGHAKGAFTGAVNEKDGLFLHANGGTIFLDEIAEMPLEIQAKLLRAIQEREITPVGSQDTIPFDVRIISASNKSLSQLVNEKHFRDDLFYRLNVIQIELPPLRERPQDMDLLIDAFIRHFSEKKNQKGRNITPRARRLLHSYHWPGNVRELYHVIESVIALGQRKQIGVEDLPDYIFSKRKPSPGDIPKMEEALANFYRPYLQQLLDQFGGNITRAAKYAGIHRETFSRLLKRYQIKP